MSNTERYAQFYGPEGIVILKFDHYYIHKTKKQLIMIFGFETGSDYRRVYTKRVSNNPRYEHWFGTEVSDILENYVEYNP